MQVRETIIKQSVLCRVFVIGTIFAVVHFCFTSGDHLPRVARASKSVFETTCFDSDGNARAHLEEWTESSGSCDRRVCYSQSGHLHSYTIKYDCLPQREIFDPQYCSYVNYTALTFPGCCPELHCTNGTLPNTTYPDCYDKSPSFSCEFWKNMTNCVDSSVSTHLSFLFNLTLENCNKTCGYCNETNP